MTRYTAAGVALFVLLSISAVQSLNHDASRFRRFWGVGDEEAVLKLPSDSVGTRWAVLVAGSRGYSNYRHQADVCHAYQVLKKGGLKDENIVVFMYDDIAYNKENPRPGVIINDPQGKDVYAGVPKDYTGDDATSGNFLAVLLGDKTAIRGGSRKVVDSGPDDHIFVYYSDHGGPGVLGMPTYPNVFADELIDVLKEKHAARTYKSLVFYVEACNSGSIFERLLTNDLNIYATTASNAGESSWGAYCPGQNPSPPPGYQTCLGNLYSVAWMEDSERSNLRNETLKQQYQKVKVRTKGRGYGSTVMQYGDINLSNEAVYLYMGSNPANDGINNQELGLIQPTSREYVSQRDADLLHFWHKFQNAADGSSRKLKAQKEFVDVMTHRLHIDQSIKLVGQILFGIKKAPVAMTIVRADGKPLVDDWDCLRSMVRTFETHCGSLSQYGMKHMRSFANICNSGFRKDQMDEASAQACTSVPQSSWSSLSRGFSA